MRILIVTQHFWPEVGGAEIMLRRLAEQWSAAHAVTVLACRWDRSWPVREIRYGSTIERLEVSKARVWGTVRYVRRLSRWLTAKAPSFDVVYVSMLKHAAFASVPIGRRHNVPVVVRAEGAGATGDIAWHQQAPLGKWVRRRCQAAAAVIAPSRAIEAELLGAGFRGAAVHWLPNGVPIPVSPWNATEVAAYRRRLGLPERTTICYTGRLHAEKGIGDLLQALPLLQKPLNATQALLVGDGPERGALAQMAAERQLGDRVHFVGAVDDVEPYLRASDLYVLPSYQEGMSLSLLEALALGMPAIAGDIAPNRDLAPATLLPLFPIRSPPSLAAIIAQQLLPRVSGTAFQPEARQFVEGHYSIARVADRHLELFRALQSECRRSALPQGAW